MSCSITLLIFPIRVLKGLISLHTCFYTKITLMVFERDETILNVEFFNAIIQLQFISQWFGFSIQFILKIRGWGLFIMTLQCSICLYLLFVAASHQTGLDTRSMTRRPIIVGIWWRGRSGTSRGSNPAGLCCSLTHSVKCGPNEPSCFLDPNLGPGTDTGL